MYTIYIYRDITEEYFTLSQVYIRYPNKTHYQFFGYACEDKDRNLYKDQPLNIIKENKVMHKTAIPYGTYTVSITYSPKYKTLMPQILNVPGFEGIRIHKGNSASDTSGCLLLGLSRDTNKGTIQKSTEATNWIYNQLQDCKDKKIPVQIIFSTKKPEPLE